MEMCALRSVVHVMTTRLAVLVRIRSVLGIACWTRRLACHMLGWVASGAEGLAEQTCERVQCLVCSRTHALECVTDHA